VIDHTTERLIEWTGERCVPWIDGIVVYEHLHRYRFAGDAVTGRVVLDLGSGEGYGAAMLGTTAECVLGIDIDASSVAHSRANYGSATVTFAEGSAVELASRPPKEFDVVVCFEVLEHVQEHEQVLAGIRHVLKDEGLLLLSTPDREPYNAVIAAPNPFHVREVSSAELQELLSRHFRYVRMWRQSSIVGSRLVGDGDTPAAEAFVQYGEGRWSVVAEPEAIYLVAAASPVPLPALPQRSHMYDIGFEAVNGADSRAAAAGAWAAQIEHEHAAVQAELDAIRSLRSVRIALASSRSWSAGIQAARQVIDRRLARRE
jgi:SAM-dependent methyltransferase